MYRRSPRPCRVTVALATVIGALVWVVAGCSADSPDRPSGTAPVPAVLVDPADFAVLLDDPDTFALNVHTPDEGSLAGTEAAIAFDQIETETARLPADRAAPVALYCRTGRMSTIAATTLAARGYTNLVELRGGMVAWEADGRKLVPARG